MTRRMIRHRLSACLVPFLCLGLLVLASACRNSGSNGPEADDTKKANAHSIIEEVPQSAVPADEGRPGTWFPLTSLDPPVRAFEVVPEQEPSRGGLLLITPWWGVNEEIRNVARTFAAEGYHVVIPDLYEGVESTSPLSAELLLRGVKAERAASILEAALSVLEEKTKPTAPALLGIGAGGGAALELAKKHPDLRLVAIDTATAMLNPENAKGIAAPLLLIVGAESAGFHAGRLDSIAADLEAADVDFSYRRIMLSGNVLLDDHAPGYSAVAAMEAIEAIVEAIEEH